MGIPNRRLAQLKGPRTLSKIRPAVADVGPKSAPTPDEAKPKMPGAVPTNRHKPIPNDFGPVSRRFDHDRKLVNFEIAQPSPRGCRALAKWMAHSGHLQGGLHVTYAGLQGSHIRDASDMQVPKWTCKST